MHLTIEPRFYKVSIHHWKINSLNLKMMLWKLILFFLLGDFEVPAVHLPGSMYAYYGKKYSSPMIGPRGSLINHQKRRKKNTCFTGVFLVSCRVVVALATCRYCCGRCCFLGCQPCSGKNAKCVGFLSSTNSGTETKIFQSDIISSWWFQPTHFRKICASQIGFHFPRDPGWK